MTGAQRGIIESVVAKCSDVNVASGYASEIRTVYTNNFEPAAQLANGEFEWYSDVDLVTVQAFGHRRERRGSVDSSDRSLIKHCVA